MNKQELIHSHILVAIFCGWETEKPTNTPIFGVSYPNGYLKIITDDGVDLVSNDDILEELPYATDWNYLMAAWDVFRTQWIEDKDPEIDMEVDKIIQNIEEAINKVDLPLAFKELVRGIEALNKLKLEEHE